MDEVRIASISYFYSLETLNELKADNSARKNKQRLLWVE